MNFARITEQQEYDRVVACTRSFHRGEFHDDHIRSYVDGLGLDRSSCVSSGMGLCGQGEYDGLIVAPGERGIRVIEFFLVIDDPTDTKCEDIASRKPPAMAILHYYERFAMHLIPKRYLKYL